MAPRGHLVGLNLQRKSDLRRIKGMCDSRKSDNRKHITLECGRRLRGGLFRGVAS